MTSESMKYYEDLNDLHLNVFVDCKNAKRYFILQVTGLHGCTFIDKTREPPNTYQVHYRLPTSNAIFIRCHFVLATDLFAKNYARWATLSLHWRIQCLIKQLISFLKNPWRLCDTCVIFAWHLCDICVTFVWHLCGICVTLEWQLCGICVTF